MLISLTPFLSVSLICCQTKTSSRKYREKTWNRQTWNHFFLFKHTEMKHTNVMSYMLIVFRNGHFKSYFQTGQSLKKFTCDWPPVASFYLASGHNLSILIYYYTVLWQFLMGASFLWLMVTSKLHFHIHNFMTVLK